MIAASILATLLFTVPSTNQLRYTGPDPFLPESTTLFVECSGGPATQDVDHVTVYRYDRGTLTPIDSVSVRGHEGLGDSITFDAGAGGHFCLAAVDTAGNPSCPSELVYFGPLTAVPLELQGDPVVRLQLFDVQGRLLRGMPRAAGVYFAREQHRSGRLTRRKVVLLK